MGWGGKKEILEKGGRCVSLGKGGRGMGKRERRSRWTGDERKRGRRNQYLSDRAHIISDARPRRSNLPEALGCAHAWPVNGLPAFGVKACKDQQRRFDWGEGLETPMKRGRQKGCVLIGPRACHADWWATKDRARKSNCECVWERAKRNRGATGK